MKRYYTREQVDRVIEPLRERGATCVVNGDLVKAYSTEEYYKFQYNKPLIEVDFPNGRKWDIVYIECCNTE